MENRSGSIGDAVNVRSFALERQLWGESSDRSGSPISGLCQVGQYSTLRLAERRRRSANPLQISVTRQWFSYAGCAVAHQSPIRIKAWRIELTARYTCPWPGTPAPENPQFLTVSIYIDRKARSHNFVAPLRTAQPHAARGAGATSLQTVGMAVARNQQGWFCQPGGGVATAIP
jgi:hypothetical protein